MANVDRAGVCTVLLEIRTQLGTGTTIHPGIYDAGSQCEAKIAPSHFGTAMDYLGHVTETRRNQIRVAPTGTGSTTSDSGTKRLSTVQLYYSYMNICMIRLRFLSFNNRRGNMISTCPCCNSIRLRRLAIALLLIAAVAVHTRILASFQAESLGRDAREQFSIPIDHHFETNNVVSDAPFYFSACLLTKDDNKASFWDSRSGFVQRPFPRKRH